VWPHIDTRSDGSDCVGVWLMMLILIFMESSQGCGEMSTTAARARMGESLDSGSKRYSFPPLTSRPTRKCAVTMDDLCCPGGVNEV
jgi:hypothetical protein